MCRPLVIYLGQDGPHVSWLSESLQSPLTGTPLVIFLDLDKNPATAINTLKLRLAEIQANFTHVLAIIVPRTFKALIDDIVYISKKSGNPWVLVEREFDLKVNPFQLASPTKDGYELISLTIR